MSDISLPRARTGSRAAFFLVGVSAAIWAVAVPAVKTRAGANDAEFGLLLLCLGGGAIVSMPVAASFSAKWGARLTMAVGIAGLIAALPLIVMTASSLTVVPFLLMLGVCFGFSEVALNVQGTEVERLSGVPLMSNFHGFFSVGAFVGSALMMLLLSADMDVLLVTTVGSLILFGGAFFAVPRIIPAVSHEPAPFALPRGRVALLAALVAIAFLVEGAILDWGALLVIRLNLARAEQAAAGFMVFSVAMTFARFGGDAVVARIGNLAALIGGSLVASVGIMVILHASDFLAALAGFFLVGIGMANIVPILFRLAAQTRNMHPNMAIAALSSVAGVGMLAAPGAIGFVAQLYGLRAAFAALCALLIVGSGIAWVGVGKRQVGRRGE